MTPAELRSAWARRGVDLTADEAAELAERLESQGIAGLYAICLKARPDALAPQQNQLIPPERTN